MRHRHAASDLGRDLPDSATASVGKRSPTQRHVARPDADQRRAEHDVLDAAWADHGLTSPGQSLPHLAVIQRSFGPHDVSGTTAHFGGAATQANQALNANAYATGDHVAFADASPSLFLVAHEAAHVVQQRGGVQLSSAVGAAGDAHERHADEVAAAVVRGESAADLLSAAPSSSIVQYQKKQEDGGASSVDGGLDLAGSAYLGCWVVTRALTSPIDLEETTASQSSEVGRPEATEEARGRGLINEGSRGVVRSASRSPFGGELLLVDFAAVGDGETKVTSAWLRADELHLTETPDLSEIPGEGKAMPKKQKDAMQELEGCTGFGSFAASAGKLVELLVPKKGDASKLGMRVNIPLASPGCVAFFQLGAEVERDAGGGGYKLRCELGGGVSAAADLWIVDAFVEARVFGYYEASGDSGKELFDLMTLAVFDMIWAHLKSKGMNTSLVYKIFDAQTIQRIGKNLDDDDYAEYGMGVEVSAGLSAKDPSEDGAQAAGVSGKVGASAGRKLVADPGNAANAAGYKAKDVGRLDVAFASSFDPFGTIEAGLALKKDGKDVAVCLSAAGTIEVDYASLGAVSGPTLLANILAWVGGYTQRLADADSGESKKVATRVGSKLGSLGEAAVAGVFAKMPLEDAAGKGAVKLAIEGEFGTGGGSISVSLARITKYEFGKERGAGTYAAYEGKELLGRADQKLW